MLECFPIELTKGQVMTNTEQDSHTNKGLSKGIYLLPNLFTTAGLFAGFYAIIAATKGLFGYAAMTIFIAMIADGLDGRVARLTNTTSAFGAEYDSLSDMVAFGIAPAVTAYTWALHSFGKIGWLIAFVYAASTAMRLARFNVHLEDEEHDQRYFNGLPSPAAAGVVAGTLWVAEINQFNGFFGYITLALLTIAAAVLMVSNVRYPSFKGFDFKGRVPFVAIPLVVLLFVAIAFDPPPVLFIGFALFALSGPVMALVSLLKNRG